MPAERKKPASMEEKESLLNNKEKDCSERRPVSSREKPKDEIKLTTKKEVIKVPEDKKKKLEEDKRKKDDKERKKKEEEKVKAEEELKKKEEEEKKKHEEEERKKQEEQSVEVRTFILITDVREWEDTNVLEKQEKEESVQLHQEAWERHQLRKEFRSKNQNAPDNRPEENFFSRLDSSLKKNTAFVKKLKTITEQQRDSLSHDFNGLNLSKYIAEAVASIVEAKLKISDVNCAVHLCSLFHQRYADFAPSLLQVWKKHFEARKEEKTPNITKLRTDLRFIAELTIVGIFTDKEGLSLIYEQLKNIINADRESHTHVSVVISFCRHCGDDIAGLVPRKVKSAAEKFNLSFPPSEIISPEKQQPFQNLLKEYFTSLTKHLKRDHRELQNTERQNRRILHSKGELSEDRHKQYEEFAMSYQKLLANSQSLADLLDENMPDLPQDKPTPEEHGPGIDIFTPGKPGDYDLEGGIWEDEDARNFYENLIDLKAFVPAILFKDNEKSCQNKDSNKDDCKEAKEPKDNKEVPNPDDLELELENLEINDDALELEGGDEAEDLTKKLLDEQEQEDEEASTGSHLKLIVDAFLQQLPNCVNRDLIDKAAMDFCMNMNTKANRKKLVRALFIVPRQR
uniref:Regulator of nonsense transcripts 2 n=1 Tax=Camelus bactrianus TaxID=9837 RepID=A0A9W3GRV7_CAMBA|nr:regulator of nonsense transcripts 2 [Camelus bactrianus]